MVFDQLKKIAELKKLQDSFKQEKMTVEKRGVTVTMNGNFEVEDIKLNPKVDPQVVGGVVLMFESLQLDGSLQNALRVSAGALKEKVEKQYSG